MHMHEDSLCKEITYAWDEMRWRDDLHSGIAWYGLKDGKDGNKDRFETLWFEKHSGIEILFTIPTISFYMIGILFSIMFLCFCFLALKMETKSRWEECVCWCAVSHSGLETWDVLASALCLARYEWCAQVQVGKSILILTKPRSVEVSTTYPNSSFPQTTRLRHGQNRGKYVEAGISGELWWKWGVKIHHNEAIAIMWETGDTEEFFPQLLSWECPIVS